MSTPGFVKPDLDGLAAIPALYRRPDLPIAVGNQDAWYIYKESATDAENRPNIVAPIDGIGRYYRMHQASQVAGPGPGGPPSINVGISEPTTAPSQIGQMYSQYEFRSGTWDTTRRQDGLPTTVSFEIEKSSFWISTGTTVSSWKRSSDLTTILRFTNPTLITDPMSRNDSGVEWPETYEQPEYNIRTVPEIALHPRYIGERLLIYYYIPAFVSRWNRCVAVPCDGNTNLNNNFTWYDGHAPLANLNLRWELVQFEQDSSGAPW